MAELKNTIAGRIGYALPGLVLTVSLIIAGCTSMQSPQEKSSEKVSEKSSSGGSQEEKVLRNAFKAIQNNDYATYRRTAITTADIMIKRMGLSPLKAKQSYVGGVLKPEELKQQREEFRWAVEGGDGWIDFEDAEFRGAGTLLDSGSSELLQGGYYQYRIYTIEIEQDGELIDTEGMYPYFVLTPWGSGYKIIGLAGQ